MAKKLSKEGAVLVLWDVDEANNNQTKKEIEEAGGKVFAYKCDLTKKEEIYAVAKKVFFLRNKLQKRYFKLIISRFKMISVT